MSISVKGKLINQSLSGSASKRVLMISKLKCHIFSLTFQVTEDLCHCHVFKKNLSREHYRMLQFFFTCFIYWAIFISQVVFICKQVLELWKVSRACSAGKMWFVQPLPQYFCLHKKPKTQLFIFMCKKGIFALETSSGHESGDVTGYTSFQLKQMWKEGYF